MSDYLNPSTWRLSAEDRSPLNTRGPVPYRLLESSGQFDAENSQITETYLIPGNRLSDFINDTFPEPITVGSPATAFVRVPSTRPMPGLPSLTAKSLNYKNHISGKPIDPFDVDPNAPTGTYHPIVEVTITYGVSPLNDTDESDFTDPRTFLEIDGSASGDFIALPSKTGRWESDNAPVTEPTITSTQITPTTDWTVNWHRCPYDFFEDTLIFKLRRCIGHVNDTPMEILRDAADSTILFTGYTFKESHTWRSGLVGKPPLNITCKFLEKSIPVKVSDGAGGLVDAVLGHNNFFRKDTNRWDLLYFRDPATPGDPTTVDTTSLAGNVAGDRTTYGARNLNSLFSDQSPGVRKDFIGISTYVDADP
jgi:hypothetical protein